MRDLVDDLMSLSRIEADRFAAPRDPVDLLPLIEEVRDALAQLARRRGRTIVVENERRATRSSSGDRGQLAQMLTNLVVNALKYGRAGTPVRIRLDEPATTCCRVSGRSTRAKASRPSISRASPSASTGSIRAAAARSAAPASASPSSSISCFATAAGSRSPARSARAPTVRVYCLPRCNISVTKLTPTRHRLLISASSIGQGRIDEAPAPCCCLLALRPAPSPALAEEPRAAQRPLRRARRESARPTAGRLKPRGRLQYDVGDMSSGPTASPVAGSRLSSTSCAAPGSASRAPIAGRLRLRVRDRLRRRRCRDHRRRS